MAVDVNRGPVGSAWLRLWSADEAGYSYVDPATPELCMAVCPEWRGRGVGTRLLEDLLQRADRRVNDASTNACTRRGGNPALTHPRVGL